MCIDEEDTIVFNLWLVAVTVTSTKCYIYTQYWLVFAMCSSLMPMVCCTSYTHLTSFVSKGKGTTLNNDIAHFSQVLLPLHCIRLASLLKCNRVFTPLIDLKSILCQLSGYSHRIESHLEERVGILHYT